MVTQQPGKVGRTESHAILANLMPTYTTVEPTVPIEATRWQSEIQYFGARAKNTSYEQKQKPGEPHIYFNKKGWMVGFEDFDSGEI